jgi:hypothetical protein
MISAAIASALNTRSGASRIQPPLGFVMDEPHPARQSWPGLGRNQRAWIAQEVLQSCGIGFDSKTRCGKQPGERDDIVAVEPQSSSHRARHLQPSGSMNAAAATTALRVTTSDASTPNMAFCASAARVRAVAQPKRLTCPQAQQACDLIDLRAGEQYRFDWLRVPLRGTEGLRLRHCWGRSGEALINKQQLLVSAATARLPRTRQTACRAATVLFRKFPLPPNQNGGVSTAHSGPTHVGDQNSAGKYPLISKPMQISTRVGVVQAICRPPNVPEFSIYLDRNRQPRKPRNRVGESTRRDSSHMGTWRIIRGGKSPFDAQPQRPPRGIIPASLRAGGLSSR